MAGRWRRWPPPGSGTARSLSTRCCADPSRPLGPGRPWSRRDRLLADNAYTDRSIRAELRRRRITAAIPEKAGQQAHAAKGPAVAGPPAFGAQAYRQPNTVERAIVELEESRTAAMRTDQGEFVFCGTIDLAAIWIRLRNSTNQDLRDRL
jgi:hypothetical protein